MHCWQAGLSTQRQFHFCINLPCQLVLLLDNPVFLALQNTERSPIGKSLFHVDATATDCGAFEGNTVRAVLISRACLGIPEGGPQLKGCCPSPLGCGTDHQSR